MSDPATPAGDDAPKLPIDPNDEKPLRERIIAAICTVFDPEIPVNIWELGLIYELTVDDEAGSADVKMTLTSPACPVAGTLPGEVETRIREVEGVNEVALELVWEPPWDKERLSDVARLQLGLM
ncbi:MAG: DUF59 domain-containing protein [Planctomycetota bacterium]|nr:DUF59 domain-containing protein [Planctomycetota bacterium]